MHILSLSTSFVALAGISQALRTVPSSPCADKCGDITNTTSSEIVCKDIDYNTPTGRVFEECITCQLGSNATDPSTGDSDLKWLLYNLRFAMSTCLWGYPDDSFAQSTPCITSRACGAFRGNIIYNDLSTRMATYDYCPNMPQQDFKDRCKDCLHQMGSDHSLSNFFTTVIAGCEEQSGARITLDGSLFSDAYVNVTHGENDGPVKYAPSDEGPIDLGTKIGIVVGSIVVALAVIGVTIICCGKRRRRKILEQRERQAEQLWAENGGSGANLGSPVMERVEKLRAGPRLDTKWAIGVSSNESPLSPISEQMFSPYESKYNSPVSARRIPGTQPFEWPLKSPITVAEKAIVQDQSQETKDEYEMERVKPRNKWEQDEYDRKLAEEWAREAASRGFTVSLPPPTRQGGGGGFFRRDQENQVYFPPPPSKAKSPKPRK